MTKYYLGAFALASILEVFFNFWNIVNQNSGDSKYDNHHPKKIKFTTYLLEN